MTPPKPFTPLRAAGAYGGIENHHEEYLKMNKPKLKPLYALIIALGLPGLLAGCAAESKCGQDGCPGDAKITANVQTRLNRHPDLEGISSIHVQTLDHVVYLSGDVSEGLMKETAETIARKTPGVTRVENGITVAR